MEEEKSGKVYEEALFSPLSVYMSQGDLGTFVLLLIKKFYLNPEKLQSWFSFFKSVFNSIKCEFSWTHENGAFSML